MADYYFDTSALAKRYLEEVGTDRVRNITNPRNVNEIYIVQITGPEIISAFFIKARRGDVTLVEANLASDRFKNHFERQYQVVEITRHIAITAMNLVQYHGLRGYDSVQLAAALELNIRRSELGL